MSDQWKNRIVATGDEAPDQLLANPHNWRIHPQAQRDALAAVLDDVGWVQRVIVNKTTDHVVDGHLRVALALSRDEPTIPVSYVELDAREESLVLASLDPLAAMATTDQDKLRSLLEQAEVNDQTLRDALGDAAGLGPEPVPAGLTEPDTIPEERPTDITRGDLFELGRHRLLCGDTTNAADVARLVGDRELLLLHADPPYGYGKEKDGVINDNLYREKLDAFQLEWWQTWRPHLTENGCAYIWGAAEDLWRFWYRSLADDPTLYARNELVWLKPNAFGILSPIQHSYAVATERCLFVMAGQQFIGNMNADEYWEGYEPLRLWMLDQRKAAGFGNDQVNTITGTQMAGHWFSRSQFRIINKEQYDKLQTAAEGRAFVEPYADLMNRLFPEVRDGGNAHSRNLAEQVREQRTYFDNLHDKMSDVWEFGRVLGEERYGHATPKPVDIVTRAIKTSTPADAVIGVPFGGTGPELIVAEQHGRQVVAIEIEPKYCQIMIDRWQAFTGKQAKKVKHARTKTKANRPQKTKRQPRTPAT